MCRKPFFGVRVIKYAMRLLLVLENPQKSRPNECNYSQDLNSTERESHVLAKRLLRKKETYIELATVLAA